MICKNCGSEFEPKTYRNKYCTIACAKQYSYKKKRGSPKPVKYDAEPLADIAQKSFQNLITYFTPELKQLSKGIYATKILSSSEIKKLKEYGIIVRRRGQGKATYTIQPEALQFLDKTSKELFPKEDSN